ncbi:MAG: uracil-DNA glycosylase [Tissierella sp.]|uniref:uracil-DNA glycosylase n=1 Tax=Tissierella sp. TaxID=41274 RepID=UPI003F9B447A
MKPIIGNDWDKLLEDEFGKEYYKNLRKFLIKEYEEKTILPKKEDIFTALKLTPYKDAKVVILGQDPYHGKGQSHGLAFSVKKGIKTPPSLRNIFKELNTDLGCFIPNNGYLEKWAKQGVLLLNTSFTVREAQANSHRKIGWEKFTDKIIQLLNERSEPIVFILWGNNAKSKEEYITNKDHFIVKSFHPSPLAASRGFFGSKPFSKTNNFLKRIGKKEIDWQIEDI